MSWELHCLHKWSGLVIVFFVLTGGWSSFFWELKKFPGPGSWSTTGRGAKGVCPKLMALACFRREPCFFIKKKNHELTGSFASCEKEIISILLALRMLRYSETRAVSCRLQRLNPKSQAKYLKISLSPWPVQILSEQYLVVELPHWEHVHGLLHLSCLCSTKHTGPILTFVSHNLVWAQKCQRLQIPWVWPFRSPAPAGFSVRLELLSFFSWCVTFYTPWLTFCLLPLEEQTRTGKDSEEIRWGKRTLRLQKTLQVPVLDFVIRYQKLVLISAGPC